MNKQLNVFEQQKPSLGPITRFGLITIAVFVGGFIIWSIFFPLDSAAIAPGKIIVESQRKTIQHLEGGIIKGIYVRDGKKVNKGELLIELDNVQAMASFKLYKAQVDELLTAEARLIAERDNLDKISWNERTQRKIKEAEIQGHINSHQQLFNSNRQTLQAQIDVYQQRIYQLEKEISSLEAQVVSVKTQMDLIDEELVAVSYLWERKLIDKPRLLALKREAARLRGNLGEYLGSIAKAKQKISETHQEIYTLKTTVKRDTLKELREVQTLLAELTEKEKAAEEILSRKKIFAPEAGIILNLQEHTIGGVIKPGGMIMEIVPALDSLIVEAQISTHDINVVKSGLTARVKLLPYKQRNVRDLAGTVTQVSADTVYDEQTHTVYYNALIKIPVQELKDAGDLKLYPGMPVQVMILTDRKTFISYLFDPIRESFNKAFREQ